MDTYSHTARQEFLSCPRKFYLHRMLRFERTNVNPSGLRMGKAYANALEVAGKGHGITSSQSLAIGSLEREYEAAIDEAVKVGNIDHADRLEVEHAQLRVLASAYIARYGGSLTALAHRSGASIVAAQREVEFDDPILGNGRLDAVAKLSDGRLIGIEDKLLTPAFWRTANEKQLAINAQVTAYFAAMRAAGMPLSELHYRVTFKPTIKPNSRTGETLPEYADRLAKRIDDDPSYAFREFNLYRTDAELDSFVARTQSVHRSIDRSKRDLRRHGESAFPANMGTACTEFGECEFLDLCTLGPGAVGYRVRPKRVKLTAKQEHALRMAAAAFTPGVRVVDVARMLGCPETGARSALDACVSKGLLSKERIGRAAVYHVTDAGAERIA